MSAVRDGVLAEVLYSFESSCSDELTVEYGMRVFVLQQHDVLGNADWWLVGTEDGQQGEVHVC